MSPRAVLVGLPGAGKTSVGRRLAKVLSVAFTDTDQLIEKREGATIAALFASVGEPAYREIEAAVIAAALAEFAGVVSLGGGALTREGTRRLLAESAAPVVYLQAGLPELGRRVGDAQSRPLLVGDPAGRLAVLAADRIPIFEQVATFTVDTDQRTPGQLAATIAARLHDLHRAQR